MPVINLALAQSVTVGTAFTYAITATNTPALFSATGLPTGLSFNAGTGIISGTPVSTGAFDIAVLASNSGGISNATLRLTIALAVVSPPAGWMLPSGWSPVTIAGTQADAIGEASGTGTGNWTLTGRTKAFASTADSFISALKPWTGDVVITAKMISASSPLDLATAGVTLRESAAPDARHASTLVSPVRGVTYTRRLQTADRTRNTAGPVQKSGVWIRLQRVGNLITSSSSSDGVSCVIIGRETVTLPAAVQVGLVVTGAGAATPNSAIFSNVSVSAQ